MESDTTEVAKPISSKERNGYTEDVSRIIVDDGCISKMRTG